MDSTVDAMAAAYDALLDAVLAIIREPGRREPAIQEFKDRLDAFVATCDSAEELIRAAAGHVAAASGAGEYVDAPQTRTRIDALCRAVQAIDHELRGAGAGDDADPADVQEEDCSHAVVVVADDDDQSSE